MSTPSESRALLSSPPTPLHAEIRSEFLLDDRIAFLNHGSFGAVPHRVFDEQTRWRRRIEAEPIEMLGRQGENLLAESAQGGVKA